MQEKLKRLKPGSAAGPDRLGAQLLQELSSQIASPLATVMRKSVEEGVIPEDVTAIFKKGSKSSPENYRPISLTSVCCKMLESILKDEIVSHLERNKLIRPSQHGFLRGKSCVTNLVEFLEKVTAQIDAGKPVDVVFLDFAKAFDKVPVERLLKKLQGHGIGGHLLRWIRAWLTGRRQKVVLNGKASDWADVLSGVPQGSVLGPLLFLIFINDLDDSAQVVETVSKFADDTKLAQTVESDEDCEKLQSALNNLMDWARKWGMQFNVSKCKIMHLGHNNRKHTYHMGSNQLTSTEEEKDLGVIMNCKLKPSSQCCKAARTAQTVLGQISRAFHFRDRTVFLQLYKQYVRPHLEFSVQAWSPWQQADIEVLEKVQRRAIQMISGLKSQVYEERLIELEITTLEERRHQADMALMYKIVTGKEAVEPETWFRPAAGGARENRSAADPLNVRVNHGRLEVRRNFFSVRVTETWNKIPRRIKEMRTVGGFKSAYQKHRQSSRD